MRDRKEEDGRRGGAGREPSGQGRWSWEEGGERTGSFFSTLRPREPIHNDTNLPCSAGPQSRAGVHHHIHQRGVEDPLQPCGGAQGGSARCGNLQEELGWIAHHSGSRTFAFLFPPPSSWWTPSLPLDHPSNIQFSKEAFLTPDKARFSPSRGVLAEWEQRAVRLESGVITKGSRFP